LPRWKKQKLRDFFLTMNENKYLPILEILYTKKQADKLNTQIEEFIASLYKNEKNMQRIQKIFSYEFTEALLDAIKNEKISLNNHEKLRTYLTNIREEISQIPVIDLTIAIDPTHQQIKKIGSWITANSKEKYLLNIHVNPKIIGGIQIGIKGTFKDKSLRKQLAELPLSL